MNQKMNIALSFDKNFIVYASATIKSILENNSNNKITFYLITDSSVNKFNRMILKMMIENKKHTVKFIDSTEDFDELDTRSWSKATFHRLMLPKICKDERILYLDSDMIINGDLSELYSIDLEGYYCAMVKDYGISSFFKNNIDFKFKNTKTINVYEYFDKNLAIKDYKNYCNAGMTLMNLDEMRKFDLTAKLITTIKEKELAFLDQDCINMCCKDKIKILPITYNYQILSKEIFNDIDENYKEDYKEFSDNKLPLILHFIIKPWKNLNVDYRNIYYKYKHKTPWRFRLDKSTRKNIFRAKVSKKEQYLYIAGKRIF